MAGHGFIVFLSGKESEQWRPDASVLRWRAATLSRFPALFPLFAGNPEKPSCCLGGLAFR